MTDKLPCSMSTRLWIEESRPDTSLNETIAEHADGLVRMSTVEVDLVGVGLDQPT